VLVLGVVKSEELETPDKTIRGSKLLETPNINPTKNNYLCSGSRFGI